MADKIGFIGLGNMGNPMASNLEKADFDLTVYNRNPTKTAGFKKVSTSIKELVENSAIVFTMLTNDQAVKDVYAEILQQNVEGKLFVDMSTISKDGSVSLAQSIEKANARFLDAPVAGSTKPAADATLIFMVGGEQEAVDRALPYLQKMGKLVKHLGGNGQGIAAKLAINYFLSTLYLGLAETTLFAEKLGINRPDMLEIINESAAGSGATKVKTVPLVEENYTAAFALDLMLKDVLLAKEAGANFPLTEVLSKTYQDAHNSGFGQEDVIGIINHLNNHDA